MNLLDTIETLGRRGSSGFEGEELGLIGLNANSIAEPGAPPIGCLVFL